MSLKRLLFSSAAVLAVGAGAQAADLPIVEPVEYVRICDAFGTGFYYIPGTDTCLSVGGYVRVESHWVGGEADAFYGVHEGNVNNWTTRARGQINLDARTQTDIGLVRTYIAMDMEVGHGNTTGVRVPDNTVVGFGDPNYDGTEVDLASAYIEIINDWGTFTAGRRGSFFDFWGAHGYGTRIQIDESTVDTNLFGWTFAAGNGFSFTIAAEDPASAAAKPRRRGSIPGGSDDDYEGQEAPDGVANIRVDQSWGSAQIMGAVRHVHDYSGPVVNPVPPPIFFGDATSDDGIGFAVGAGLTLRLPGGWRFDSQGGYAEGAVAYVTDDPGALGDLDGDFPDDLNKAWSVRAGIIGPFINPNLSVWLDGSFTHVEEDGGGTPDADEYDQWAFKIGARWEPVPGLGMGPEFAYQSLDMDDVANPGTVEEQPSFDVWGLMWRIQRNF